MERESKDRHKEDYSAHHTAFSTATVYEPLWATVPNNIPKWGLSTYTYESFVKTEGPEL